MGTLTANEKLFIQLAANTVIGWQYGTAKIHTSGRRVYVTYVPYETLSINPGEMCISITQWVEAINEAYSNLNHGDKQFEQMLRSRVAEYKKVYNDPSVIA